jgi:hypothetical protein
MMLIALQHNGLSTNSFALGALAIGQWVRGALAAPLLALAQARV